MRRASILTAMTCVAVAFSAVSASAVEVFLSEISTIGGGAVGSGAPAIDTSGGGTGQLGIWVDTAGAAGGVLNGISLDLVSDSAGFTFDLTSAVPQTGATGGMRWFDDAVDGYNIETYAAQSLTNIIGVAIDAGQGGVEGEGIGAAGDALQNSTTAGMYLFATIDYTYLDGATGNLTLTAGANGIIDGSDTLITPTITGATFASGPGFDILDVNQDTFIDYLDIEEIFASIGDSTPDPADVDGSGTIDIADLTGTGTGWLDLFGTVQGDANLDKKVDSGDFGLLAANFGTGTTWNLGDFNGTDPVDSGDFGLLAANFGFDNSGSATGSAQAVPEPSSLALVALSLLAMVGYSRKNVR